jgi:hypothetical protein
MISKKLITTISPSANNGCDPRALSELERLLGIVGGGGGWVIARKSRANRNKSAYLSCPRPKGENHG